MTADLKPYPSYKDSSVSWLGDVPEHWEVFPHRALFNEVKEREHPDEQMLSVTITQGVVRQRALLEGSSKKDSSNLDKSAYKLVCPGDIAYNKMRAWQGAMGASDLRGIVSPAYVVQRLRDKSEPRYFHHLFRTPHFAKEAERWSYGITSDMWSLRPEHFKMIYSCVPTPPEQAAIVRFLDHMDRRIRRYIRAKQKLIKLLEEQRQAIIHRVVTRGLNPNVRLRPSGVAWLGQVPEHWETVRNGQLFTQRNETGFPDLPILEVSLKTGVRIRSFGSSDRKQVMTDKSKYKRAAKGDLAYNMMRMWQGAVGVTPVDGLVSPAYVTAKPLKENESQYFSALFRTTAYMAEVDKYSRGIVKDRNRLYWEDFKQIPTICPPPNEQLAIADAIDQSTASMNSAIQRIDREIALLREYRTRLIADVVTGKLDVREAAARLLAEAEELEEIDQEDALIEGDEENEESNTDAATEEDES
jgi:type I restriction enzyme, S subunit